ncbi:hypothetical protein BJX66DRAFT_157129 [Aspergillus keveii]|uniref:Secreted protein n=1 Tax=Aspergillus keveii TaxID=714993 RepID=A0ABR4G9V1_9EURO
MSLTLILCLSCFPPCFCGWGLGSEGITVKRRRERRKTLKKNSHGTILWPRGRLMAGMYLTFRASLACSLVFYAFIRFSNGTIATCAFLVRQNSTLQCRHE